MAGAGNPAEEIVVQKVVPTRPELSLEIGVLWLGLGYALLYLGCMKAEPKLARPHSYSTPLFAL